MKPALRVRDFMATKLHTVEPEAAVMDAVRRLVSLNVSGLLVVDAAGALIGIMTERDCIDVALQAGYFDETGGRVEDYMSRTLETVAPDDNLMDVAERFARDPHRRFPVVDDGRLVGLIARRDVLRALTSGAWFRAP